MRVLALRFFLAGRQEFIDRQRGARASGAGPSEFVFCGRLCKDKRWANSALARPTSEGKSKNSPCPTSRPPFDPRQGSTEASAAAPGATPAKRPGSVQADAAAHSSIAGTKVFIEHSPLATRERQRALFGDHQGWLGTSQAWNSQHPRARANRQHSEDAIEA